MKKLYFTILLHSFIYSIVFIILLFYASCSHHQIDVRKILDFADNNRFELEKVIEHYHKIGDPQKNKAVYYLIGNMHNKYWNSGEIVEKHEELFNILDSLHKHNIKISNNSNILSTKFDSIKRLAGVVSSKKIKLNIDCQEIKAEYLINNIDLAFKLRDQTPWGKQLSFEQFCEYLLPYRVGHEPLEPWREYLFDRYKAFFDTVKAKNSIEYASKFNNYLYSKQIFAINRTMWEYPFEVPLQKLEKGKIGSCKHLTNYVARALRARGFPVAIDNTPLWGNHSRSHDWLVLFTEDGKKVPFNAVAAKFSADFHYKIAKAYRESFAYVDNNIPDSKEIPDRLKDNYRIDVTHEYTKVFDIEMQLKEIDDLKNKYAFICSFDDKNWVPQDWGRIKRGRALFKNMGSDLVYLVMYYNEGNYYPASDPFILTGKGEVKYLTAKEDRKQEMTLLRKFPVFPAIAMYLDGLKGGRIQGANRSDFKDSVNLFTISTRVDKIESAVINNSSKFRYVRYISPYKKSGNIAELEFYSDDSVKLAGNAIAYPDSVRNEFEKSKLNAFDSNPETYYNANNLKTGVSWVGLDLKTPKKITKVRFCPRSDTNFILVGDTYELCYWEDGEWVSMGTQIAKDQFLIYKNVPSGGLYLLHNLSRGKEERIFTYEGGKQVFY